MREISHLDLQAGARDHLSVQPFLIAILLALGGPGHRHNAERAEGTGHMAEAAREYEAAYREERAPELLYRLAIVRRKLKQYARAREALRGYLREAPEGGLQQQVELELRRVEVLLEAQQEDFSEPRPLPGAVAKRPPVIAEVPKPPATRQPGADSPPAQQAAPPSPPAPAAPGVGQSKEQTLAAGVLPSAGPPAQLQTSGPPAQPQTAGPPAQTSRAAPPAAVQPQAQPTTARSRAIPWLASGAGVALAIGAGLWWDGARLGSGLDARYAHGDLAPADQPLYQRAHREGVAGRVLVGGGVGLLAAAAVASWW